MVRIIRDADSADGAVGGGGELLALPLAPSLVIHCKDTPLDNISFSDI